MRTQYFLFTIILYFASINCYAQITKDTTWQRSEFVEDTDDFLSLKLNANNDISHIFLDSDNFFDLRPNTDIRNNLSVNYKWLTVGLSFTIPDLYDSDEADKGETETTNFRLSFNADKWSFSYDYLNNKGYYLENSQDFLPPDSTGYIIFPNLQTQFHRFYIGHILNPRFSLKALTSFTERQLQGSGSLIPFLRLTYFRMKGNNDTIEFQQSDNFVGVLGISYSRKFVFKKYWYAAAVGSIGYGYISSKIEESSGSGNLGGSFNSAMLTTQVGGSAGYNGNKFFGGINFNRFNNNTSHSGEGYSLDSRRNVWEIFIGYRVRTPKFLRKPLNWADDQKKKVIK